VAIPQHTLVFEGGANSLENGVFDVCRRVNDVEVFATWKGGSKLTRHPIATPCPVRTSLSDDSRITLVDIEVLGDILPQLFEDSGTPGEVKSSEERVGDGLSNDVRGGAGDELNHTRRDTGLLQQLVHDIVRVRRGG